MSELFISYKREEQPEANKLADALQKKGWTVWWDPNLRAGEHFDDAIERALNDAKCVIVMWSKLSVNSRYVKDEATYALNRKKLLPIAIEKVDLPFRFEGIQTGHLINWDGSDSDPGFQKLVADIENIINASPVTRVSKRPSEILPPKPTATANIKINGNHNVVKITPSKTACSNQRLYTLNSNSSDNTLQFPKSTHLYVKYNGNGNIVRCGRLYADLKFNGNNNRFFTPNIELVQVTKDNGSYNAVIKGS